MLGVGWLLLSLSVLQGPIAEGVSSDEPARLRTGAASLPARLSGHERAGMTRLDSVSLRLAAGQADANEPVEGGKSPSIVEMLEGYESELMVVTAIAAAFFIIGWICGGNYYVRRERKQRNKIRL